MRENLVKNNLSYYFPALIQLCDGLKMDWDYIDSLFAKEIAKRTKQANGETIQIETNIYYNIVKIKKGDKSAIGFMDFLNKMVEELCMNLYSQERALIKPNIRRILTSFNIKFLDFVGEIAVLNNLIKSKSYRLHSVEAPLPNGKAIDFTLRRILDNTLVDVEVSNIHLDSERVEANNTAIRKFLTDRLTQKIAEKKEKLFSKKDFFLVPVIWGQGRDIKIYSDYFKNNKMHIEQVIEPLAYITFSYDENSFVHRFGTVSTLFGS